MLGVSLHPIDNFRTTSRNTLLLLVFFLGLLWTLLLNQLRVEWTLNPQYGYGWAVPFLCAFLLWKKLAPAAPLPPPAAPSRPPGWVPFVLLALLFAPTRLIQAANPEWRLVSWALALEVVGLTWLLLVFVLGPHWAKRLAFPLAYFLVAVPWPTPVEAPVIQGLTRADAGATVELLGWLGVPAMTHGNVIEVATGEVGIDEACSGIRSFQATLMLSLFLGELYRLNVVRRLGLVLAGFTLSFVFNLARMSVLVWVAAHQGIGAIARWHDPTGVTILLACFFALWGLGTLLAPPRVPPAAAAATSSLGSPSAGSPAPPRRLLPLLVSLLVWVAAVEISVETWYRWHEWHLPPATRWTMAWPTNNPTLKDSALADRTRQLLRYDEGRSASWQAADAQWQAVFLRWNPGRTAVHLVQNHTPEVCLTAAGHTLTTLSARTWFAVGDLQLPFTVYAVVNTPQPVYVFYCLWDDRTSAQGRDTLMLNYGNRLAPVLAGLRNPGQRSLEIALTGALDPAQAQAAFQRELPSLIRTAPPRPQ